MKKPIKIKYEVLLSFSTQRISPILIFSESIIKEFLSSEDDEQIADLENKLIINVFEDERGIQFKIEDDA